MIYPKLGVKIGAGKTPGIYHPVVGVLKDKLMELKVWTFWSKY